MLFTPRAASLHTVSNRHAFDTGDFMKIKFFAASLMLLGCSVTGTPLINSTDLSSVDFSKIDKLKRGEDCAKHYLGFGPFGTRSIRAAAKNGGIAKVKVIDNENTGGFFSSSACVVAYGN